MIFAVVTFARRPDLGSYSRLCLPLLNSAVHFYTVDKPPASSPNVATMSNLMSIWTSPPFSFIIPDAKRCPDLREVISYIWTVTCQLTWKQMRVLLIRRFEISACNLSQIELYVFIISLFSAQHFTYILTTNGRI